MPRVLSEQYVPLEHISATSTSTADVKTLTPSSGKRAIGVWITVEGAFAARVTFDGTAPGTGAPPGLLIPTGTPPLFFPFPFGGSSPSIRFASNGAGNSTPSGLFVL